MALRHLISPLDLTEEETTRILDLADRIGTHKEAYAHLAEGKQLATLFYEPSTRTRLSFESAMLSLGGQTLGCAGAEQSSATKGETVADTVRVAVDDLGQIVHAGRELRKLLRHLFADFFLRFAHGIL